MPSDFSSQIYWQERFAANRATFEWLAPRDALEPFLLPYVHDDHIRGILHIGCGTSELSLTLRRLFGSQSASSVLNLDFAPAAIDIGMEKEKAAFGDVHMRWATADLLNWSTLEHLGSGFGMVVEKSCTDALSCGEDVRVSGKAYYPPTLLAFHLARLTKPGAVWIALSYSASRFEFPPDSGAGKYWELQQQTQLKVEEELTEGGGLKPTIWNHVYILRRTAVRAEKTQGASK